MKKMMRKFAAAVLGLCLLISGLWMAPVQADASGGDGWVGAWSTSPVEFNLKKMLDMEWIKCILGCAISLSGPGSSPRYPERM